MATSLPVLSDDSASSMTCVAPDSYKCNSGCIGCSYFSTTGEEEGDEEYDYIHGRPGDDFDMLGCD